MSSPQDSQRTSSYAIMANATNNYSYAVFCSILGVVSSNLHRFDTLSPFRQVTGTLCSQEWECMGAFFCNTFKILELQAQIYENAISITTRSRPKDGEVTGWWTSIVFMCIHF
jgi:hypothetical protein